MVGLPLALPMARELEMPRIELLDPTQNGRPAEHLENKLGYLVVRQEEAIDQIVTAHPPHGAGLSEEINVFANLAVWMHRSR
jgi:hypothetical protein